MKKTLLLFLATTLNLLAEEKAPSKTDEWCNGSVTLSALIWQPQEDGLDYVIRNKNGTAFVNNGKVERIDASWDIGFRLGFGYKVPNPEINLNLDWTRFHTSQSDSASAPTYGGLYQIWTIPGSGLTAASNAKAKWRLNLDTIDLKMSSPFSPRSFLELRPFIGICTAWVNQRFNVTLDGGSSTTISNALVTYDKTRMKNDYWGIGPKVGLETRWLFGCGLSLYGNVDGSILCGWFDLDQSERVKVAGLNTELNYLDIPNNHYYQPRSVLGFNLGLRWDRSFCQEAYHFTLQTGWENLIFFSQNQLMRFTTSSYPAINVPTQGDLTLQGVTVKGVLVF